MSTYLANRFEFKYLLSPHKARIIEAYIQKFCTSDLRSEKGPYYVNSLYYDTPLLDDCREKDASLLVRRKLRARMYQKKWSENIERVWLEVKKKRNMNIKKVRVEVDPTSWQEFMNSGNPNVMSSAITNTQGALDEFSYIYRRRLYRPHLIVRYERSAYLSDFLSLIRITFDKNIQTCRYGDDDESMLQVSHGQVIMELKYNHKVPWWVSEMITRFNLERSDFSKYRNSVAIVRGHYNIPVNK